MANPQYTAITKKGLEAIVDATSTGTLIELKYFVPIYDYRSDASVKPVGFTDENMNISRLFSNLDISHADIMNTSACEILYKDASTNGDYPYSLSYPHIDTNTFSFINKGTSATSASGTTIVNVPYGAPKQINLVNENPVSPGWKIYNTNYAYTGASTTITGVTSASPLTSAVSPNIPDSLYKGLYESITYSSITNDVAGDSVTSRAAYTVILDDNVPGDFKFNMIATYCIIRNSDFSVSSSDPVLFSLTVLPNTIIKSNSMDNAIQSFTFDLNLDFTFGSTGAFNKILYVDSSETRAVSWHTKQDGTIGTNRNVAVFDKYNSADYNNMAKLLVGVTKYVDSNNTVVTTIPSMGEVYQDQTDPFPSNWNSFKVLTFPTSTGYEITFSGDYANVASALVTGSGLGFSSLYGYYAASGSIADDIKLPGYYTYFAPALGLNTTDDLLGGFNWSPTTSRWDSLHTLNGFTVKNSLRAHPLWNMVSEGGEQLSGDAQAYSNDYHLSADVLTGFHSNNLSFIVDNTFEFHLSSAPAYTAVQKILKNSRGVNVTVTEDVWNPYFGTLVGDLHKHWVRNAAGKRANQDLFIRTDLTQLNDAEYDINSQMFGDIYMLAGLQDYAPMHRRAANQNFHDDSVAASRSLMIKALSIIINGDLIPYNPGSTVGTPTNKFSTVYTDSFNDILKLGYASGSRGSRYALTPTGVALGKMQIGTHVAPLASVATEYAEVTYLNGVGFGWHSLEAGTRVIEIATHSSLPATYGMYTSASGSDVQVTTANLKSVITNFKYSVSPDKMTCIKFNLKTSIKVGSEGNIPYIEMLIKDTTFLNNIAPAGRLTQLKFVVALPYIDQVYSTKTYINSNVEFIFNSDAQTENSTSVCPVSILSTNNAIDTTASNWWYIGAITKATTLEDVSLYGVLTDDTTFTFADLNIWVNSNYDDVYTLPSANYFFPYYGKTNSGGNITNDVKKTPATIPLYGNIYNEFFTWLDNNRSGTVISSDINNQFAIDMDNDMIYNNFRSCIETGLYGRTGSTDSYCKILPNLTYTYNSSVYTPAIIMAMQGSPSADTWLNNSNSLPIIGSTEHGVLRSTQTSAVHRGIMFAGSAVPSVNSPELEFKKTTAPSNNIKYRPLINNIYYPQNLTKEANKTKLKLSGLKGSGGWASETNIGNSWYSTSNNTAASEYALGLSVSAPSASSNTFKNILDIANNNISNNTMSSLLGIANSSYNTSAASSQISMYAIENTLQPVTSESYGIKDQTAADIVNSYSADLNSIWGINHSTNSDFNEVYPNCNSVIVIEKNITLTAPSFDTDVFGTDGSKNIYAEIVDNGFALITPTKYSTSLGHTFSYRGLILTKTLVTKDIIDANLVNGNRYSAIYHVINITVPAYQSVPVKYENNDATVYATVYPYQLANIVSVPFNSSDRFRSPNSIFESDMLDSTNKIGEIVCDNGNNAAMVFKV